jgi:uncharacterized protein YbcC (UPF0753/DUF2309 family)
MSTDTAVRDSIARAADAVGPAWPLHSFVTANPLAGFEDRPFHEAVARANDLFGGRGYPSVDVFRQAYAEGRIDPELLTDELTDAGYDVDPETALDRMAAAEDDADAAGTDGTATAAEETATDRLDRILTKWLAAFLDQGHAEWSMPNRDGGFYAAFRATARHDRSIPDREQLADLPEEPVAAIEGVLREYPIGEWETTFEYHLAALPGWTGLIKQRAEDGGEWQSAAPITLADYLAVRLTLADLLDAPVEPPEEFAAADAADDADDEPLAAVWLRAWEQSYREELVGSITAEAGDAMETAGDATAETETGDATAADGGAAGATAGEMAASDPDRPDAQLVFCIDTRSEIIRRHVEAAGDYETHGYAGFFGVPMRYEGYDSEVAVDACPPIVDAQHHVADRPADGHAPDSHDRWTSARDAGADVVKSLKSNAATAFSFVEHAGSAYGLGLAGRTLVPATVRDLVGAADEHVPDDHEFCEPSVDYNPDGVHELREGLTHEEKVEYAATAFELMGWTEFARLVVFTGHASETANNPFGSSLDCGACAGNPGGPSARVLAAICNDDAVRASLRERGIDVPDDTVFLAGQHNTTTDEIDLYDADVPESHRDDLEALRADLETARAGAAAERAGDMGADDAADETAAVAETERRAADWAETRPEWGLAGNAAFVIGPRELTADLDLDARSFLHSYDWATDDDGDALEAILTGPMVVTQWINCQYYFATVDTAVYGSGSKVTQNPVGNVGVYQGNGGDLLTGLPQQSVMAADDDPYHQPLRLSTVVHAPVERVTEVLAAHENLTDLLDNGWLSLTVVDPEQDNIAFDYDGDLTWTPVDADALATTEPTTPRAVADD